MSKRMAWMVALASVTLVLLGGAAAVWLTSDLRALGFVIMGVGVIASGLAAYFEWRANLPHRMLAETSTIGGPREEE